MTYLSTQTQNKCWFCVFCANSIEVIRIPICRKTLGMLLLNYPNNVISHPGIITSKKFSWIILGTLGANPPQHGALFSHSQLRFHLLSQKHIHPAFLGICDGTELWALSFVKVQFRIGVNWLRRSSQGKSIHWRHWTFRTVSNPQGHTHTYLVEEQDEIDGEGDK